MKQQILEELEEIKKQTDFIIDNKAIVKVKDIEKYLRNLEKIRYEMFNKIKISNQEKKEENEKINYINNSYKAKLQKDILKIYIPEVLPKFKNISNYAYKNIMLSTAEAIKDYKNLFNKKLTLF